MSYSNYESKAAAFNDPEVSGVKCPVCGIDMAGKKWLNQGDQRYINIFTCETDGSFFVRLRFKKHSEELLWDVRKLIYPAEKAHVAGAIQNIKSKINKTDINVSFIFLQKIFLLFQCHRKFAKIILKHQ